MTGENFEIFYPNSKKLQTISFLPVLTDWKNIASARRTRSPNTPTESLWFCSENLQNSLILRSLVSILGLAAVCRNHFSKPGKQSRDERPVLAQGYNAEWDLYIIQIWFHHQFGIPTISSTAVIWGGFQKNARNCMILKFFRVLSDGAQNHHKWMLQLSRPNTQLAGAENLKCFAHLVKENEYLQNRDHPWSDRKYNKLIN